MTSYYDALAEELFERYEGLEFEQVHRQVLDELPDHRAQVLDVGAGSGRDAAALARRGHSVVAVEPAGELRELARSYHSGAGIRWVDDELPGLEEVYDYGETYDLILLSAVWMHLAPAGRDRAMRKLVGLLEPGGRLIISTRTVDFTGQRTLHRVQSGELVERGEDHGLEVVRRAESEDLMGRGDVDWSTVVFRAVDDGTEALPVLRNIIVNDDKFATYKFGLLRTLLRVAAGARGLVEMRDDGTVAVPTGLVCLYWLKNYWRPVLEGADQMRHGRAGFGRQLEELDDQMSLFDLRLGARFSGERAEQLHATLRKIRKSITSDGPVRHITYLESDTPIFVHDNARTSTSRSVVELTPAYLWGFGTIEVPRHIFQAMERHWVWIEPTILGEWTGMMRDIAGEGARTADEYSRLLEWPGEDPRDTGRAARRVEELSPVDAVWTGRAISAREDCEIDHCIPYSRWFNNSLWNLLPATPDANSKKGAKLPAVELLADGGVRERMTDWWRRAFVESDDELEAGDARVRETFVWEADASLPGTDLEVEDPDLEAIYEAVQWQVGRMRRDQQIESWGG